MSDRWIHIQHNEVRDRNRAQRLATQAEAQRLADGRRDRADEGRDRQERRS